MAIIIGILIGFVTGCLTGLFVYVLMDDHDKED